MSQQKLAARIGCRSNSLSRIERGRRGISQAMLAQIAEVLDVPLLDLRPSGSADVLGPLNPNEIKAIEAMRRLSPHRQELVTVFALGLVTGESQERGEHSIPSLIPD